MSSIERRDKIDLLIKVTKDYNKTLGEELEKLFRDFENDLYYLRRDYELLKIEKKEKNK